MLHARHTMRARTRACERAHTHTCSIILVQHTYRDTHTHAQTHTHTHSLSLSLSLFLSLSLSSQSVLGLRVLSLDAHAALLAFLPPEAARESASALMGAVLSHGARVEDAATVRGGVTLSLFLLHVCRPVACSCSACSYLPCAFHPASCEFRHLLNLRVLLFLFTLHSARFTLRSTLCPARVLPPRAPPCVSRVPIHTAPCVSRLSIRTPPDVLRAYTR